MSVLEQVSILMNQGKTEQQVISELQQQGIPPKQINDAIEQFKIKNAIANAPQEQMTQEQQNYQNQEIPAPAPTLQDVPSPEQEYAQEEYYQQPQEQMPAQQQEYSEYYPQEEAYQNYQGYDSNSIVEISEQIVAEKTKNLKKEINKLKESQTITDSKIEDISNRLKRIENTIDKLQITILEKIGSYGEDLNLIKKEISMVEDSFKKMTGQIAEKISKKIKK